MRAGAAVRVARAVWLTLLCGLTAVLVGVIAVSSFSSVPTGSWPPPGLSTRWYDNVFAQPDLLDAALLSLQIAAATTVVATLLGLGVAIALTRFRFRGRRVVTALTFAPIVVPKMALGFALVIYLSQLDLYGDGTLALLSAHAIITLPFAATLLSAALVRADVEAEEAARDLGANPARAFVSATFPQIRAAVVATAVFVFIVSFDEVDTTIFLLPEERRTLPVWMFNYMEKSPDPTLAALSTLLIAASLVAAAFAAATLSRTGVLSALVRRPANAHGETKG